MVNRDACGEGIGSPEALTEPAGPANLFPLRPRREAGGRFRAANVKGRGGGVTVSGARREGKRNAAENLALMYGPSGHVQAVGDGVGRGGARPGAGRGTAKMGDLSRLAPRGRPGEAIDANDPRRGGAGPTAVSRPAAPGAATIRASTRDPESASN